MKCFNKIKGINEIPVVYDGSFYLPCTTTQRTTEKTQRTTESKFRCRPEILKKEIQYLCWDDEMVTHIPCYSILCFRFKHNAILP